MTARAQSVVLQLEHILRVIEWQTARLQRHWLEKLHTCSNRIAQDISLRLCSVRWCNHPDILKDLRSRVRDVVPCCDGIKRASFA